MDRIASAMTAPPSASAAIFHGISLGGPQYTGGTITGRHQNSWKGARTTVTTVERLRNVQQEFRSNQCRLLAVLGGTGTLEMRVSRGTRRSGAPVRHLSLVPPNVPVWGVAVDVQHLRHLVIDLERRTLEELSGKVPAAFRDGSLPQLMFQDEGLQRLGGLLADACLQSREVDTLYGEGLSIALQARLCERFEQQLPNRYRSGLAPWQLRRVFEFFECNLDRRIRVGDLSEIVKLSQSYFCRAFKVSTGYTPHHWQMKIRVERAMELLASREETIADIACRTGFADQAHLSRVFRELVGSTPGAWRRDHGTGYSSTAGLATSV
jgi:AraC family transcriptional regulator